MRMGIEQRTPLTILVSVAVRALSAQLTDGLRAAGFSDLRAAHAQVFVAFEAEGSRLTDLAARAGMTKQAMGELVHYLEQHGYLQIEPDPRDRRAKVIQPTERGWRACELSVALQADGDRRLEEHLGKQAVLDLRTRLRCIGQGADS